MIVVWYVVTGILVWLAVSFTFKVILPYVKNNFPSETFLIEDESAKNFKDNGAWWMGYLIIAWPFFIFTAIIGKVVWSQKDE
jgi:hypothetical protein